MPPNDLLKGRYRCLESASSDGQGSVYKGVDDSQGTTVCIKEMRPADFERARYVGEQLMHLSLSGLPRLLDHFRAGEHYYFVYRWLEGQTLEERARETQGDYSATAAYDQVLKIGEVLMALHKHEVLHGYIKPDNLMLAYSQLYLCDLGGGPLAVAPERDADYYAPEVFRGQITERSDVYSLAAVLYRLLAGKPPTGRHLQELRPDITARAAQLIHRCLDENPQRRPRTMELFVKDLRGCIGELAFDNTRAATAEMPTAPPVAGKPVSEFVAEVTLLVVAVLGAIWLGAFCYTSLNPPPVEVTPTPTPVQTLPSSTTNSVVDDSFRVWFADTETNWRLVESKGVDEKDFLASGWLTARSDGQASVALRKLNRPAGAATSLEFAVNSAELASDWSVAFDTLGVAADFGDDDRVWRLVLADLKNREVSDYIELGQLPPTLRLRVSFDGVRATLSDSVSGKRVHLPFQDELSAALLLVSLDSSEKPGRLQLSDFHVVR